MMKKTIISVLVLALSFGAVFPSVANAQATEDNESITLSPVSTKYKIDAGQAVNDKLTVVNDGKTDYDFIVYSRPYSIPETGDGNYDYTNPNFTETTKNADAYGWIRFSQTKIRLAAGATAVIDYSISVPKQAAPGGHYGVIFAETQPATGQASGNSVIRKKRVGSLVYVTVNGEFTTGGQVESTDIPFWQLQPPLRVETNVKNTGNSDFTDDTVYTVKDVFGNIKYKEIKQYTVLPQTTRKMAFEWKQASWFGLYKVELGQTVLGKTSSESGYVLILPRYIPILLIVFVLVGGGYAWFRRKNARSQKK